MPSASNNTNQSNTKLVKQTSVNSVNSGGASGTSTSKGNKKLTENTTKSNNTTATTSSETSSIKTAKENTNNVVATTAAQQQNSNSKNWETASAAGNATSATNKDAGNDALNPMKLTFTTIEHKIRNLEKRKTKLEGYRAIQASGKELSSDQRAAVAKYDAVMATLEFARDLVKQMQQFTKDAEKEQKKQARKDLIAKAQAETIKIREVLIIQNILSCFTDEAVRTDFLSGENGAAKIETNEIDILEKFCFDVQTRRPETSEDAPFATSAQKAAEIFSMTIDARPKQYGETTYENVKRIFHRIQESDYLDKIYLTDVPEPEIKPIEDDIENMDVNSEEVIVGEINNQEMEVNALDDGIGMEKLNIEEGSLSQTAVRDSPIDNVLMGQQQQQQLHQQAIIKDHLDMQQQQQQVAINAMPPQSGQPLMAAPMAPPATAVPSFQPATQAAHSGASTPVHVAMYHPSMQQPTPQLMQQMPIVAGVTTNAAGQIITGLAAQQAIQPNAPPSVQQQQQQATTQQQQQQQRQMLTSPAGQAGVGGGPIALHNVNPQQQPLPPTHFNPTPVHAVEQNYFKSQPTHPQQQQPQQQPHQQQPQPQYLQQIRPLAEVIGSGNFYFLQDSELDSPDLTNQVQGVPQSTIIFEQQQQQPPPPQQQQQNLQQTKPTQNLMSEQNNPSNVVPTLNQQQQQQLQQVIQQLPLTQQTQQQQQPQQTSTQTPIQTQTFTNQSFPQMQPPSQTQQQVPNVNMLSSNTPSPLFQPQQQQQQNVSNATQQQLFSPVQNQNIPTPQQQQQQQQSQLIMAAANEAQQQPPPPTLMMMNRLAAANPATTPLMQQQQQQAILQTPQQINPQNLVAGIQQLPNPLAAATSVAGDHLSQTAQNAGGFPFEITYEQQMQNKLNNAANVLKNSLNVMKEPHPAVQHNKNDLINEWDEAVLKGPATTQQQQDYKSATSTVQVVESTNKWSAEVNANSPITVQQTQTRKNEWTSSTSSNANNNNNANAAPETSGYVNDNRTETNHWHSQDSAGGGGGGGYARGSTGNRGANTGGGGYQRQRNDDRRDDRRPGGGTGGGGGYRGRSNYGSGNPQQNGPSRGGGGGGNASGIYFRNNENTNNNNNSYYQNGSGGGGGGGSGGAGNVYSNKDSRYESRGGGGGGGGNYRGPRGSDNNSANPRNNGPPPRHMGNRTSGSNANPTNTNSNSYMNSRQSSNRMPLGIENKN